MSGSTRRGFLAAGLGTAAGAVVLGGNASADAATTDQDTRLPEGAPGVMSAWVHDVHSGHVTLMIDGHDVTVTDKKLVARIVNAYHRAARGAARG